MTTTTTIPDTIATLRLVNGKGAPSQHTADIMSAARILSGQATEADERNDSCDRVPAEVRTLANRVNDWPGWESDTERTAYLLPIVPLLLDTITGDSGKRRRAYLCADVAVRVIAPIALDARGRGADAARLRDCTPIVDRDTALTAASVVRSATATDATYATYAAVNAAATDATYATYAAANAAAAAAAADAKSSRPLIRNALVQLLRDVCAIRDEVSA